MPEPQVFYTSSSVLSGDALYTSHTKPPHTIQDTIDLAGVSQPRALKKWDPYLRQVVDVPPELVAGTTLTTTGMPMLAYLIGLFPLAL